MTIEELKQKMIEAEKDGNEEDTHIKQDCLLLEYINNSEITEIYNRTDKWFA